MHVFLIGKSLVSFACRDFSKFHFLRKWRRDIQNFRNFTFNKRTKMAERNRNYLNINKVIEIMKLLRKDHEISDRIISTQDSC